MPRLGAEAREERRSRFVEAARRCAASKGYRSFTVDDVCAEAGGLSKGAFYTYFRSKQDLLLALLEHEAQATEALIASLARRPIPELERAHRFLKVTLERGEDPSEVQRMADLWAEMVADETVRRHLAGAVAQRRKLLAEWIDDGVASGEIVDLPPNAFAAIIVALADGLMLHRALDPTGFRWANIRRAVDTIFEGLRPDPSA